jgi:hypothetical protein
MLIDNPLYLEVVTKVCGDKNDILAVSNGTLESYFVHEFS